MSKSIISNERRCVVCGTTNALHVHHIFFGPNRKLSDKYGCWVYLCYPHHNGSNEGVHFNRKLDLELKDRCQRRFEEVYPDLDFMKIFGKNYKL